MDTLDNLPIGCTGKVVSLVSYEKNKRRLLDLGLVKGVGITHVLTSPSKGLKAYDIRGSLIAIRDEDSKLIKIQIL